MKNSRWQKAVLLGAGGARPCLDVIYPNGEISRLLEMPPGQSVYAIDRSPGQGSLAVGTRDGQVRIVSDPWRSDGSEDLNLAQGAAVLSLCWCGDQHLAVSDLAGRVLLWDIRDPASPQLLDTKGEVICALCLVKENLMAGLCVAGALQVWNLGESKPVSRYACEPPPERFALVKLEYLSHSNELIYPARQGQLIRLELESGHQAPLKAHDDDFYAFTALGEKLITAGLSDQAMKVWQICGNDQAAEHPMGTGILQLAPFPGHSDIVAAITESGFPGVIHLNEGRLTASPSKGMGDYRYAVPVLTNAELQAASQEEARCLASQLESSLDQGDVTKVDDIHHQLRRLGYEHVALGMRSAWAIEHGDFLSALDYSARLINLLPIDDPRSFDSLQRHAQLLTRYWLLDSAFELYSRMKAADSSLANPPNESNLYSFLTDSKRNIFEPAISLEEIIKANGILQQAFGGTYVLSKNDTYRFSSIPRSPEDISDALNHEFTTSFDSYNMSAEAQLINLLSEQGASQKTIIEIGTVQENPAPITLGLLINTSISHSDVIPMILFKWNTEQPYQQNNKEALAYLEGLGNQSDHLYFLDFAYRIAVDVIRRIATEEQTQKAAAL